jgi:hypothetical protein
MLQDEDNHLHTRNLPKGCLTSLWSNPANQIIGNFGCPDSNYWGVQLTRECIHKILPIEKQPTYKRKSNLSEKMTTPSRKPVHKDKNN